MSALPRHWRLWPALARALTGQCTVHHGRIIALSLELIELLERQIADLNEQIGSLVAPRQPPIAPLDSLPGVEVTAARDILGEIDTDMGRFGSAARLSSGARMSPGNNESAGKRRQGRTGKGTRSLRRLLVPCAWAARKTPTFLGRTLRRLEARMGGKRAAVAVGHKSLVIVYHRLVEGTYYEAQRYADQQPKQEERERKRAIKTLERLGYSVTVERVASLLGTTPSSRFHRLLRQSAAPGDSLNGRGTLTRSQYFVGTLVSSTAPAHNPQHTGLSAAPWALAGRRFCRPEPPSAASAQAPWALAAQRWHAPQTTVCAPHGSWARYSPLLTRLSPTATQTRNGDTLYRV